MQGINEKLNAIFKLFTLAFLKDQIVLKNALKSIAFSNRSLPLLIRTASTKLIFEPYVRFHIFSSPEPKAHKVSL